MLDVLNLVQKSQNINKAKCEKVGTIQPMKKSMSLKGVEFSYFGRPIPVLRGVNLEIKKGEWIGIRGGTGSGKSSLLDVIMGLLMPSAGSLSVDGQLIKERDLSRWMKNFALVPQYVYLLDASIADNISFMVSGKASDDRIQAVSSLALVDEFVSSFPQGFETRVGERGVMLSGGQRQRLGIARALAREAPFLVLDEATNALDTETEKRLMQKLRNCLQEKTVLMVSHHSSSLAFCDRIIEIREGKIYRCNNEHAKITKA